MQVGFILAFSLMRGVDKAHIIAANVIHGSVIHGRNVWNGDNGLCSVVGNGFFRIVGNDVRTV